MSRPSDSVLWGATLAVIGAGFLLWNLDLLAGYQVMATWALVALFVLLGLAFVFSYLNKRTAWWQLIPGFTFFAVAAVIALSARGVASAVVAGALLGGIALAFLVIYLSDREERWWALIPFGSVTVMMAAALLSLLPQVGTDLLGAVLFGGMGLVFFLIYALARERQRFVWALAPATTLGIMALVALAAYLPEAVPALAEAAQLWPVVLLLSGVVLMGYAALRTSRKPPPAIELPPQAQPTETPLAPGASVVTLTEDQPADRASGHARSAKAQEDKPPASKASGEVDDIYEFLKSAPPEGGA